MRQVARQAKGVETGCHLSTLVVIFVCLHVEEAVVLLPRLVRMPLETPDCKLTLRAFETKVLVQPQ